MICGWKRSWAKEATCQGSLCVYSAKGGDAAAAADQHLRGGSGQESRLAAWYIPRRGQRNVAEFLGLQRRGRMEVLGRARQWLSGKRKRRQEVLLMGRRYKVSRDAASWSRELEAERTYSAGITRDRTFFCRKIWGSTGRFYIARRTCSVG